jgi:hypothetical protein
MQAQLEVMRTLVNELGAEIEKFEKGNSAAGTRARKTLMDIKTQAQDMRVAIQDAKNATKK